MKTIKIKTFIDLPLEVGKTYKTKFQTGDIFTVLKLFKDKTGNIYRAEGVYENAKHLGVCPIDVNRLINDKEYGSDKTVCGHCNTEIT